MNCDEHFAYSYHDALDSYFVGEFLEKNNPSITSAEIPETFNGKQVLGIEDAFRGAKYLERVTLPNGLSDIGSCAFRGCSGLREIVWADGLEYIETRAFEGCTSLERLELPEGLLEIYEHAFGECTSLKEVILPHSLERLEEFAFCDCSALEKVVFLNKDVRFGGYVFYGCTKLTAETLMYSLIFSCDIEKPFDYAHDYNDAFEWDAALREDVFELAMEHNSFELVDKYELFLTLLNKRLMERYFPYMKINGWIYREEQIKGLAAALRDYPGGEPISMLENAEWFAELFPRLSGSLLDALIEVKDTELTAWLLEYKSRHFGFVTEDNYEL